jgi:hypothetical protein
MTNSTWTTSELSNKHGEATFQNVSAGYYTVTAENFTASSIYLAPAPIPATVTVMLAAGIIGAQLCALAFPEVVFSSAVQTWLWLVAIACPALFAFIESRQKTMRRPVPC